MFFRAGPYFSSRREGLQVQTVCERAKECFVAKLTMSQKAERVLTLLLALRNARIAGALKQHGFTNADLEEGWTLLRAVTRTQLDEPVESVPMDSDALRALDAWENQWFVIASATLGRRAPQVHERLFRNLSQTDGVEVIVSVGTFLERLDNLDKPTKDGGLGNEGKDAKKLLAARGLSDKVIGEAKALVHQLSHVEGPLPDLEKVAAEEASFEKAEENLWAWYLEWSTIARSAIKQRSLLIKLGFLRGNGRSDGAAEEESESNASAEGTGSGGG